MKRSKTIEVTVCDGCGHDCDYPVPCLECGKNFCYECRTTKATDYPHSVYCSGTGDGLFCHPCETKLMALPTPIFAAYLKIKRLRNEINLIGKETASRVDVAEAELKAM